MKNRKYIGIIITLVSFIVLFGCVAYFLELRQDKDRQVSISDSVEIKEEPKEGTRQIDFDKLLAENEDTIGWVEVPGTEVDYPVVICGEDLIYMDHDFYGEWADHGTIFVDDFNGADFSQLHTVLYGHNMRDGSMFGSLHEYQDEAFFEKNRDVYIYTPDGKRKTYRIFAAYERDDAYLLKTYDYDALSGHEKYLSGITSDVVGVSNIDEEALKEIGSEDPIITLYTCTGVDEWRYIVQAVYVEE